MQALSSPVRRTLFAALALLVVALCLHGLARRFSVLTIVDDGYMGVRYVDNFLNAGQIEWNLGGPPTYGMTSLLFLLDVLPARLLFPNNAALAAIASTALPGALFLGLTLALFYRRARGGRLNRWIVALALFLPIAAAFRYFAGHLLSGVDTCFTLLYALVYLWLARRALLDPDSKRTLWAGIAGGIAYWARPDLLIFALGLPALMALAGSPSQKRAALRIGLLSLAIALAEAGVCELYFHAPAPLSFYVKGMRRYGPELYRELGPASLYELRDFALCYWPYMALAIAACFRPGMRRLNAALCLCALAFLGYYAFFVLQILHADQRFYYPALPALLVLASDGAWTLGAQASGRRRLVSAGLAAAALLFVCGRRYLGIESLRTWRARDGYAFNEREWERHKFEAVQWYKLDDLASMPEVSVATTEIGLPGVLLKRNRLIDLAGLHETHLAQVGFSASWFFARYRPDWLYMPYPPYKEMTADILASPVFQNEYDYYPAGRIGAVMGVALFKKGPFYSQLKALMPGRERGLPPQASIRRSS